MGKRVSKYKLWLAGADGSFAACRPIKVKITDDQLRIGHHLTVDLSEIASCRLQSIRGGRARYIELVVCSPAVNRGEPTPVHLLYPRFWPGTTNAKRMQAFVDALTPRIAGNRIDLLRQAASEAVDNGTAGDGRIQVHYAFGASVLLAFAHWRWFAFERPRAALVRTYVYMYLSAILNSLGILIVLLPRYNWIMSGNIERLGGSRRRRLAVYVSTLLLPPCIWVCLLVRFGGLGGA